MRLIFAFCLMLFCFESVSAAEKLEDKSFLVELFTSQGCSSCPAADKFLVDVAQSPEILALSMPVDIWDFLGWKDTLARKEHTEHQKYYAQSWGLSSVFTPQMVINGTFNTAGTDFSKIRAYLSNVKHALAPHFIWDVKRSGSMLVISLPKYEKGKVNDFGVFVYGVSSEKVVAITRGENAGEKITYKNVVRSGGLVKSWSGQESDVQLDLGALQTQDVDFLAIVIKNKTQVLAAKTFFIQ